MGRIDLTTSFWSCILGRVSRLSSGRLFALRSESLFAERGSVRCGTLVCGVVVRPGRALGAGRLAFCRRRGRLR